MARKTKSAQSDAQSVMKVTPVGVQSVVIDTERSEVAKGVLYDIRGTKIGLTADTIPAPYNVDTLIRITGHSSVLRQPINAYAVNIDGFGHSFVPTLDLDRDDIVQVVGEAMFVESGKEPTRAQIKARIKEIKSAQMRERVIVQSWFDFCVQDTSFVELRKMTRVDLETTGNAYWEVIRDKRGKPQLINHIAPETIELTRLGDMVEVPYTIQLTPITMRIERRMRRFRRYVQAAGTQTMWFKEYGDPRLMSAQTGIYYKSAADMAVEEPEGTPATEVYHFRLYSPDSGAYGVPRWLGAILAVRGTREAEEINFLYFENKSVPPMAILVSGGSLDEAGMQRIKDTFENDIHGKKNFHRILVLQAEPASGPNTGQVRIEIVPLTGAQLQDAQHMEYLKYNAGVVTGVFRLPPLYRGEVAGFNRATAQVAVRFAEEQVFQPERAAFDFIINRFFLTALDIKYWRFKSHGPSVTDFKEQADSLREAANTGALTVNEYRAKFGQLYDGRELDPISDEYADHPVPIALEMVKAASKAVGTKDKQNGEDQGSDTPNEDGTSDSNTEDQPADNGDGNSGDDTEEGTGTDPGPNAGNEAKPEGNGKGKQPSGRGGRRGR